MFGLLTAEEQHAIITRRDRAYDAFFVFAVKTTGIYCLPSCPAPRPLRQNVLFFANAQAAQQAGFRACKRCHPDNARIERAHTSTADLSARQLRRITNTAWGIGPAKLQRAQRLQAAEQLLITRNTSIASIAFEAGFSSVRQFNRLFKNVFNVTPQEYRMQSQISTGTLAPAVSLISLETPVGPFHMVVDVSATVILSGFGPVAALLQRLPRDAAHEEPRIITNHPYQDVVRAYFEGDCAALDTLPRLQQGSVFQTEAWQAISRIPAGQTRQYSHIAEMIDKPRAVRAVGTACGQNRLILLVPCHRVVPKGGKIGNYLYGSHIKEFLLRHEAATVVKET